MMSGFEDGEQNYQYIKREFDRGSQSDYDQNAKISTLAENWELSANRITCMVKDILESQRYLEAPVWLPPYDPEDSSSDPRVWINFVDILLQKVPLKGGQLILSLSQALKGCALQWLGQVSKADLTWREFKGKFLSEFHYIKRPALVLFEMLNSEPQEDESFITYSNKIITKMNAHLGDLSKEQIILNITLGHMAKFSSQIRRLACTKDIKNKDDLVMELSMIQKSTPLRSRKNHQAARRARMAHYSHKHGVEFSRKRFKPKPFGSSHSGCSMGQSSFRVSANDNFVFTNKKMIVCFHCKVPGHYVSRCPRKNLHLEYSK